MDIKNIKGITLIALVITIIVLLILAGVSVATLTGESGLLTQANKAKLETRGASVEEAKDIWEVNKAMDRNTSNSTAQTLAELVADLEEQGLLIDDEPEQVLTTGQVTIGSRTIVFGSSAKTLVQAFKDGEIQIGDYISYNPVASGDSGSETKYSYTSLETSNGYDNQTYTVNNNTEQVNWIVLGLSDDEEHLLITSGSPVRKEGTNNPLSDDPYFRMSGSTGYINAETELKNISAIYGHGDFAESARSITIEDINKLTGFNPDEDYTDGQGEIYEYGNDITITGNGDGTYNYLGTNEASGTFSWDHTSSGFQYIDSSNQLRTIAKNDTSTPAKLKESYYYYNAGDLSLDTTIYNKFFNTEGKYYWLASRAVGVGSSGAGFSVRDVGDGYVDAYGLFGSDGVSNTGLCGVRPVVSLESGVTVDDLKILGEQQEPSWGSAEE